MSPRHARGASRRRGSILLMALMLIPVMLLLAALMLEFGMVANGRSEARTVVDAAAKAGAIEVGRGRSAVRAAVTAQLAEAGYAVGDGRLDRLQVDYGKWNDTTRAFSVLASDSRSANAVRVEIDLIVPSATGSIAGFDDTRQTISSVAMRPGIAMAVKNSSSFLQNDRFMIDFLEQFGVPIRVISESQLGGDAITEGEVLFISSSVSSSAVPTSLRHAPGPLLVGEANVWQDFGYTRGGKGRGFFNYTTAGQDIEVDLYEMDESDDWREAWEAFWEHARDYHDLRGGRDRAEAMSRDDGGSDGDDAAERGEGRVEIQKQTTNIPGLHGVARRNHLSSDAVVIATAEGRSDLVTCFWYDQGARLADGGRTPYKQAGIFMRTTEWSADFGYEYNDDGYALVAQSIRWLLYDQEPRTVLVE